MWLAAIVAAFMISGAFGLAAAALATAGTIWLGRLTNRGVHSDATRAEILTMLEVAAMSDIPPSRAIRASLSRLDAMSPTWGVCPIRATGWHARWRFRRYRTPC